MGANKLPLTSNQGGRMGNNFDGLSPPGPALMKSPHWVAEGTMANYI